MITVGSKIKSADNAGGILYKCITVFKGFARRYARLGELVGTIANLESRTKKQTINRSWQSSVKK